MKHPVVILITLLFISSSIFAQQKQLKLSTEADKRKRNQYNIICNNNTPGKKMVTINFSSLGNTRLSRGRSPLVSTVSVGRSNIVNLSPISDMGRMDFRYSYTWVWGCNNTKHDSDVTYLIPLANNRNVETIGIRYLGEKYGSYSDPKDFYNIGFKVEVGDTIFAARKGTVVDLKNNAIAGSEKTVEFKSLKNYILVQHEDCTMSRYSDLGNNMFVKVGDEIYPRQPLSVVDETDYAFSNHIKFYVYYPEKHEKMRDGKPTGDFHYYAYITPNFLTQKGIEQLQSNSIYTVKSDEEIIKFEMSKKQKKKYKKGELY